MTTRKPRARVERIAFGDSPRAVLVPAPVVTVDMNVYRRMSETLQRAFEAFWLQFGGRPVELGDDGLPTLAFYDRCTKALAHWGVTNARLDWDPTTNILKVS